MENLTKSELQFLKTVVEDCLLSMEYSIDDNLTEARYYNTALKTAKQEGKMDRANDLYYVVSSMYKEANKNKARLKKLAQLQYKIKKIMKQGK